MDAALIYQLCDRIHGAGRAVYPLASRLFHVTEALGALVPPHASDELGLRFLERVPAWAEAAAGDLHQRARRIDIGNSVSALFGFQLPVPPPAVNVATIRSRASSIGSSRPGTSDRPAQSAKARRVEARNEARRLRELVRDGHLRAAGELLARVNSKSRAEAALFIRELGPRGLQSLLSELTEEGTTLCRLDQAVARASGQPGVGVRFLDQVAGPGLRPDRAGRIANLLRCGRAELDGAWAERSTTILLKSYTVWSQGGPGRPPRDQAQLNDWLDSALGSIESNRAGALRVLTRHRALYFSFLGGEHPANHRAAAVLARLSDPPRSQAKAAEDALELLLRYKASDRVQLNSTARIELARLLRQKVPELAHQAAGHGHRGKAWETDRQGFNVPAEVLRETLAELMQDPRGRTELLAGTLDFATGRLDGVAEAVRRRLEAGASAGEAAIADRQGLEEVGALFGALASRPLPSAAVADTLKVQAQIAKNLLVSVGGLLSEAAKARPEATLAVTVGTIVVDIVFDLGMAAHEQDRLAVEAARARRDVRSRETLQRRLRNELRHLAVVALFTQEGTRSRLIPQLPPRDGPYAQLYDEQGRFRIPSPDDARWEDFLEWTRNGVPDFGSAVEALYNEMGDSFEEEFG